MMIRLKDRMYFSHFQAEDRDSLSRKTKASPRLIDVPSIETDVRIDCSLVTASISTLTNNARVATSAQKREKPLTLPPKLCSTPINNPPFPCTVVPRVPYVHRTAVARDVE